MRVLQLIDSLEAGGAERMAVNYANALHGRIEVSALCTTRKEGGLKGLLEKDIPYLFLNKKRTFDLSALLRLRQFIKIHNIQLIQAHGSSYFTAVLVKISISGLKLIWHDHYGNSEFLDQRNARFLKPLSQFFDGVIAVNDTLRLWVKDVLHVKKAFYIKNFIADPLPLDSNFKPKGIKGKRLVCVANLRPQKNHKLLLKSFEELLKVDPEFTLHLFGASGHSAYAAEILKQIHSEVLRQNVFYYGSDLSLSSILPHFDIGVLASDSEGLPLALLEYGQAGLAVISTDVGQCKRVIEGAGLCIPSGNEHELSEAILYYGLNKKKAEEDSIALKSNINDHYDALNTIDKYIILMEKLFSFNSNH